ncbi:MAG: signal recognition particle receptor subunit alpha, partial [Calditrichaeota bacterium]|nr:signal recognition particle receptor subunit alpha [Calditrichota bacterium]
MLEAISERLDTILRKIKGEGRLTEDNIKESMAEVREALLEADVNFKVVKDFIRKVETKAIGTEVLK